MITTSIKTITVVSRELRMDKTVKAKNVNTGNISISEAEKNYVGENDSLTINVSAEDGTSLGSITYPGRNFHKKLVAREKRTKSGNTIKFYTIKY